MKYMAKIAYITGIALALTAFVVAQQSGGSTAQNQPMEGMQGMQGMHGQIQQGQQGMMGDCHRKMQALQKSNAQTKRDIESAKQSNDPGKMRAALDEADKALTAVNDHINSCMSMMNMMQGKHEEGTTTGRQGSPPHQ